MGKLIWGGNIGDGGHNFIVGRKEVYGNIMPYKRDMVWEVHEGFQVEYRCHKETTFLCNFKHGKINLGSVGSRVRSSVPTKEEKDIMCGRGGGDWVLWGYKGGGIFPCITECGVEVLVRCHT